MAAEIQDGQIKPRRFNIVVHGAFNLDLVEIFYFIPHNRKVSLQYEIGNSHSN